MCADVQEARFAPHWARQVQRTLSFQDKAATANLRERILPSEHPILKKTAGLLQHPQSPRPVLRYTQGFYRRTNWGSFEFGETQELAGTG
jgi:hypothetical protein